MYSNKDNRLAVLQGLMDSDGWVCSSGTGFASTSEQLINDVIALVQSLGGIARKSIKKNCWSLSINIPLCPFRLKRKADKWCPNKKYKPIRLLKGISYYSREQVRCIAVSCKNQLYITDNYIVTHNTASTLFGTVDCDKVLITCPAYVAPHFGNVI